MHKQFEKEKSLETSKRLALRRNEPELRIFEQKLRDALVFKEQICQMKEKRHKEIQRQIEKRRESEVLTKILMEKEDLKNIVQEEKRLQKESYASILQLQMDLQKQMEKQKEEETRQEKVKLIELEEELLNIKIKEKECRKNKTELYNYETDLHNRVKKVQEYKSNLIALEEEARAKKYEKFQNDRELQRIYDFKLKMKRKEETLQKLANNTLSLEKASEEREKLIKELQDHEYKIKQIQNDNETQKKTIFRKELVKMLKMQIELQSEHEKRLKEEELRFKNQLLEQAKEEETLENESKTIFQLINKKYSFDIQLQMEASKIRSEKQKELAKNTLEYINQYNNEKTMEIENEKIAMIQEYNAL